MKISKQELIDMGAREFRVKRFIKQTNDTDAPVEITSLIGGACTYKDLLWLAAKKGLVDRVVKFACACALINIEKIKPHCLGRDYHGFVDFLSEIYEDTADNVLISSKKIADIRMAADTLVAGYTSSDYSAAYAVFWAVNSVESLSRDFRQRGLTGHLILCAGFTPYNALSAGATEDQLNDLIIELFKEDKQ